MPLSDTPTKAAQSDLDRLRAALDEQPERGGVPRKHRNHLLVASWNLRAFGGFTDKWASGPEDSPKRDLRSLLCISEILSRFDVVALQELRSDTSALRQVLDHLNEGSPNRWRAIITDVTRGDPGNDERLGLLYDSHKVEPSGLAAELVLPVTDLISSDASSVQFARTPYAVSFRSGHEHFTLVTLHVVWGTLAGRTEELGAIARWLADWAVDPDIWASDVITLGDFNIDREGSERWQAFVSTGLWLPWELFDVPRTIFGEPGPESGKFYDQIAWFGGDPDDEPGPGPRLSMRYRRRGGSFDFVPHVMRNLSRAQLSHRISDHYPLWVEFDRRP